MKIRNSLVVALGALVAVSIAGMIAANPARAGNADAARGFVPSPATGNAAATSKPFAPVNARGIGTSKFFPSGDCNTQVGDTALACPTGDVCFCWQITIPLRSTQIGNSTLTMDLNFDLSQSVSSGTATGLCLPGSGLGAVKFVKGGAINVGFTGVECDSTVGADASFNGSGAFQFIGGTGKYANSLGQATASLSASFSSTGPAAVAIDGGLNK